MATTTYLQLSGGVWTENVLDLTSGAPSATYKVITAGTGYSVGDTLLAIPLITQGSPFTFSMKWVNLNTGLVLASSPVMANITLSPRDLGQKTAAQSQSFVYASDGTLPLPTGASTAANQPTNAAAGSTTTGQTGNLIFGAVTTAAPAYTTGQSNPLSLTTAGALRVTDAASASIDAKTPAMVQNLSPILLYGLSSGGNIATPVATRGGKLSTAAAGIGSVFGEQLVAIPSPFAQGDFVYGLNSNIVSNSTTGSGTATSANQMAVVSTTAAASSSATIRSVRTAKYRAGQGVLARFTAVFTAGVANSSQTAGMFNAQDGFGVGYNGTSFGVLWRRNSVNTWTAQAAFNLDPLDGTGKSGMTIDPTKINIFKLQIGYLGVFGCLFSVINPANGEWVDFHRTSFANSATQPQFINPTLWFQIQAANTSNTSNIVVKSGSFGVFLEGERSRAGDAIYAANHTKSIASGTDTSVLSVRCNTTINGVSNNSTIRIRSLSVGTLANVPAIVKAVKNATLGGVPSYASIDANNSLAAVDTAGTTVTGGITVFNTIADPKGTTFCDLTDFDIQLQPGETLTISVTPISGGSSNQLVTINWSEDT